MNRKRTVIFIVSAILIIFFFISGCKKDHGEDAVLTYESEYFPLVDIELGISEAELRSTFDGESIYTGEDYLAGKNRYRVFIRKLEERQYGGLLTEQYYFDETEDELICMKARIDLFAPAEYYRNEETEAELLATGYDNIRNIFLRLKELTGVTFDKTADELINDIISDNIHTRITSNEKWDVLFHANCGMGDFVDHRNRIAGKNGSFSYAWINILIRHKDSSPGVRIVPMSITF